jgi:hypothetical protein
MQQDMLFRVLYVGDAALLRELVWLSAQRLGATWRREAVEVEASLLRLRVLFFLLVDRDMALKEKLLDGWPELGVPALEPRKAERFLSQLRAEVIEPWLVDERRTEDEFLSAVTDLYLVS